MASSSSCSSSLGATLDVSLALLDLVVTELVKRPLARFLAGHHEEEAR